MPPQHRVGLNDQQRGAPLPPRAGEQDPKEPIPWPERQACTRARQHGQLLTKGKVLKGNRSVSAAHQADRSEEYDKRRQHTVSLSRAQPQNQPRGRPLALWRSTQPCISCCIRRIGPCVSRVQGRADGPADSVREIPWNRGVFRRFPSVACNGSWCQGAGRLATEELAAAGARSC